MALMHIRLELARTQDFPEGSSAHGYEGAIRQVLSGKC